MNLDHANAILGLLRANPLLTVWPAADGTAGSGQGIVPPGSLPPYVAVHISGGPQVGETINRASSRAAYRVDVHCAGATHDAALAVADIVDATLVDVIPTIPGRSCRQIRRDPGDRAPRVDESVSPPVWSRLITFVLESGPG